MRAWVLLVVVAVLALATDLGSKWLAFERVAPQPVVLERAEVIEASRSARGPGAVIPWHEPVVVVPRVLNFTLVLNRGAVFGIAAGQRWFFVVFTLCAVAFAIYGFAKWSYAHQWGVHTSIGLVLGGGLGNLYDRLMYACVRDFIHPLPGVQLPFGLAWPGGNTDVWPYVSNIADLYLILGIVVLVAHIWRHQPEPVADEPRG